MPSKDPTVTDKQVEASRNEVEKLRKQVEEERLAIASAETSRNNVVEKATLDNEAERLKRELAALREQRKVSTGSAEDDIVVQQIKGVQGNSEAQTADELAAANAAAANAPDTKKEN